MISYATHKDPEPIEMSIDTFFWSQQELERTATQATCFSPESTMGIAQDVDQKGSGPWGPKTHCLFSATEGWSRSKNYERACIFQVYLIKTYLESSQFWPVPVLDFMIISIIFKLLHSKFDLWFVDEIYFSHRWFCVCHAKRWNSSRTMSWNRKNYHGSSRATPLMVLMVTLQSMGD